MNVYKDGLLENSQSVIDILVVIGIVKALFLVVIFVSTV